MAQYPASSVSGMAVFSTRNGKYAQRHVAPHMSIVIRSDPVEDRDTMAAKLINEFPTVCKAITTYLPPKVGDYFDGYDQELHGFEFLRAVLLYIGEVNAAQARKVQDFVGRWMAVNAEAFAKLAPGHVLEDLFTEEDIQEYGKRFLEEALIQVKRLRDQADRNEATQQAVHMQQQHSRMTEEHRHFVMPHTPAHAPNPSSEASLQNLRSISNPEQLQSYPGQGPVRQIPPPLGQFSNQQIRYPQQRLDHSTELLEQIHPGSTKRGDFHSDPAGNSMDSYYSPKMNYGIAIPSRGVPGPFGYVSLGPVPLTERLSERHRNYNKSQPRGKKNPIKRSSDDARRGGFEADGRRQSLSRRRPSQFEFGPTHVVQSPQPIQVQAPNEFLQSHVPSYLPVGGSDWDGQQQRQSTQYQSINTQDSVTLSFVNQGQLSSINAQGNPSGHNMGISFPSQAHQAVVPTAPQPMADNLAALPSVVQERTDSVDQHPSNSNAPSASSQAQISETQDMSPQTLRHQIPDSRVSSTTAHPPTSKDQRFGSPTLAKQDQLPFPYTPQKHAYQSSPRKPYTYERGCRIWISGIPTAFDRKAVREMLGPCRGLVEVTEPGSGSHKSPDYTHIFASFRTQYDAEEALDRIPQTRFACLPEDRRLVAKWPVKQKPSSGPERPANLKQRAVIESPTKAPQAANAEGSISREAGKVKSHSKEPSMSTTTNLQSTTGTKNSSRRPSMPAMGAEVDEVDTQAKSAFSNAELSTNIQGSDGTNDVAAPLASKVKQPECTKTSKSENDPFAVNGGNDSRPVTSEPPNMDPQVKGRVSGKAEDRSAERNSDTFSARRNQKKKNKSKSSIISQSLDGGTPSAQRLPTSENTRPVSKPKANLPAKSFLGSAALPQHQDDAAKVPDTEIEAPRCSHAVVLDVSTVNTKDQQISVPSHSEPLLEMQRDNQQSQQPVTDPVIESTPSSQLNRSFAASPIAPKAESSKSRHVVEGVSKIEVLELPLEECDEPISTPITRDASISTREEERSSPRLSSTAATSDLQTQRSNSIASDLQAQPPSITQRCPEGDVRNATLDAERLRGLLQVDLEAGPSADESQHSVEDTTRISHAVFGSHASTPALAAPGVAQKTAHEEEPPSQSLSSSKGTLLDGTQPPAKIGGSCVESESSVLSPKPYADNIALLSAKSGLSVPETITPVRSQPRSPERRQGLSVPQRSSSLQTVPAPIITRHKKKPKKFTRDVDGEGDILHSEGPPARHHVDDEAVASERSDCNQNLQSRDETASNEQPQIRSTAQAKPLEQKSDSIARSKISKSVPDLPIDPILRTPSPIKPRGLPKPETLFKSNLEITLPTQPISKPTSKSTFDAKVMSSEDSTSMSSPEFHRQDEEIRRLVHTLSDSGSAHSHQPNSPSSGLPYAYGPRKSYVHGQVGIDASLDESGYRTSHEPSSTLHFGVKDLELARLGEFMESEELAENNGAHLYEISNVVADNGQLIVDRVDDLWNQRMANIVKDAAAARRLQAESKSTTARKKSSGKQENTECPSVTLLEEKIEKIASRMTGEKAVRGEREITGSVEDGKIREAQKLLEASPRRTPTKMNRRYWESMATQYIQQNASDRMSPPSTPTRVPRAMVPSSKHENSSLGCPTATENLDQENSRSLDMKNATRKSLSSKEASKAVNGRHRDPEIDLGAGRPSEGEQISSEALHPSSDRFDEVVTPVSPQTLVGDGTPSPKTPRYDRVVTSLSPQVPHQHVQFSDYLRSNDTIKPSSPQTLDHRAVSQACHKEDSYAPMPNQSPQFPRDLEAAILRWKDLAASALKHKGENSSSQTLMIEAGQSVALDPNKDRSVSVGHDAVGFWGQSSGAKDSDIEDLMQEMKEKKIAETQKVAEEAVPMQLAKSCLEAHSVKNETESGEKNRSKVNTAEESEGHASGEAKDPECLTPDSEQAKTLKDVGRTSTPKLKNDQTVFENNTLGNSDSQFSDQEWDSSVRNQENDGDYRQDSGSKELESFTFESKTRPFTIKGHQDDSEYPILSRGNNHSTKGGKNKSPTRGGYAAAAKANADKKDKKQHQREGGKKPSKKDPWATPAEDVWGGRRRGSGGRKQLAHGP